MIKTLSALAVILVGWFMPHAGLASRPVPGGDASLTPILDRMASAVRQMQTLQAALVQQKAYTQLGLEDPPERGVLYAKRKPDGKFSIRVEIKVPDVRILTVKDNYFTFYQPRINQVIEGSIDRYASRAAAGFLAYLLGGLSQAMEDYSASVVGEETIHGRRTTHLTLIPKVNKKGLYRQVDLWIDHSVWLPIVQKFIEVNRDVTTLTLDELRLNVKLPENLFSQKLPSTVQRVKG